MIRIYYALLINAVQREASYSFLRVVFLEIPCVLMRNTQISTCSSVYHGVKETHLEERCFILFYDTSISKFNYIIHIYIHKLMLFLMI